MHISKFIVVRIDSIELKCQVYSSFDHHEKAVDYMSKLVDKNHRDDTNSRIYHENSDTISVWNCGMFWGKTIVCKYRILEYKEAVINNFRPYDDEVEDIEQIIN